jgi:23S rRNA pseudouridine1911/1915/1917 synthase
MKLNVLHVDNHLLAVEKLAGEPVVPDESGDLSLLERAKEWVRAEFQKPGDVFLGVVHRLDRPVSGLVLFARTSKAASRLSEQFRARGVRKLYFGASSHEPRGAKGEEFGELEQWLLKDADERTVAPADEHTAGAQLARTRWRVAGRADGLVHLDLEPLTGRPHQLRVACATLGAPLLGDVKYGAREPLSDRSIALHAAELDVEHPTQRVRVELRCAPPPRPWWAWRNAARGASAREERR